MSWSDTDAECWERGDPYPFVEPFFNDGQDTSEVDVLELGRRVCLALSGEDQGYEYLRIDYIHHLGRR